MATQKHENWLRGQGYNYIAGVDEVGRGALAGPIVAAAVIMPASPRLPDIDDSKKLTPKKRQAAYQPITRTALAWSIGIQSAQTIDQIGIQAANKRAMHLALGSLSVMPDYILVDALNIGLATPNEAIIHGDQRIYCIATASIIAKVTRDAMMVMLAKHYPVYGFDRHKGYGSAQHCELIRQHGASTIHRRSFLKNILNVGKVPAGAKVKNMV